MNSRGNDMHGIGYAMFYKYKKVLNGVRRPVVNLIDIKHDFVDAVNIIKSRITTYRHDINDYYIVSYNYDSEMPERIKEYKLVKE